jgi:hypothetical protein
MFSRVSVLVSAVVVSLAALAVQVCSLTYAAQEAEAAYACSGKQVYPTQNLANVAGSSPGGTTFCVHDGSYNISTPIQVQNNDKFIGLYNDSSRPQIATTKAKQVFAAGDSNGATIKGLKISGAVGGDACKPGCGQGIRGGRQPHRLRCVGYQQHEPGHRGSWTGAAGGKLPHRR